MSHDVSGPRIEEDRIVFTFPDPDHELLAVRLYQEIERPRNGPDFVYVEAEGIWQLEMRPPNADRIEYLIELQHADGSFEMLRDPNNPVTSDGAFGAKSVVQMPGYTPPRWLEEDAPRGPIEETSLRCRAIKDRLYTQIWRPHGDDGSQPLPLLVVHDGPEYAKLSGLTHLFDVCVAHDRLPPFRAVLIEPKDRDQIYSASASYARSLAQEMIPALLDRLPTPSGRNNRIGMGASLGALAMLHAHRRSPAAFGALFLQSGSYFRMRFDKQESGFVRFRRISRFVGEVLTAEHWAHPVPVTLTCGTIEENLANNRAVSEALLRQGYDVRLFANRDGHNWVGWRDTFEPHLVDLLNRMWR